MTCDLRRGAAARGEIALAAAVPVLLAVLPLLLLEGLRALDAPCIFKTLTGAPCLSCGLTRAATALLRGELAVALRLQPLGVAAALAAGLAALVWSAVTLAGARLRVRLAAFDRSWLRLAGGYLLLTNWLYLVEHGI